MLTVIRPWGALPWGVALLLLGLVGCQRPAAEVYPVRTDRLVVGVPEVEPGGYPPLGRQDEAIAALDQLPGGRTLDPMALPADVQVALGESLRARFGTPADPRLPTDEGVAELTLSGEQLRQGSALYAQVCLNCHGSTGNGRGYGVGYVYPLPRDFRTGMFKCADGAKKPTVARLKRLLREGVPGTQMAMVDLLAEADIEAVLSYVVHLSVRGECEAAVLAQALDPEVGLTADEVDAVVAETANKALAEWRQAVPGVTGDVDDSAPKPESMRRGAELYLTRAGCVACHGRDGAGGQYRYDVWGQVGRTGNLTAKSSEYNWGGRSADILGHLKGGIRAARMPAVELTDEELLDLVAFVKGLSLGTLPTDVRGRLK